MRTEDFILSSNVTPSLEMIDSTVLRITPTSFAVILTLSNSASKLNVSVLIPPSVRLSNVHVLLADRLNRRT